LILPNVNTCSTKSQAARVQVIFLQVAALHGTVASLASAFDSEFMREAAADRGNKTLGDGVCLFHHDHTQGCYH
jgi:hypothetical protein